MINDKYKELRRALAEGKIIQLNGTAINGGYGETWNDCSEENLFIYDISAYRVKPEKTQINYHGFKEGDLVTNKDFCEYTPFEIRSCDFRGVSAKNQHWWDGVESWKPEIGKPFWGKRFLGYETMYKYRVELFIIKKIHKDGTLTLISPLDKNVYSYWIEPIDVEEFYKNCKPFIGELPTGVEL